MSFFFFFVLFNSLPDGSEGSVQPGSTLTNSTWGCLSKKSSLHTTASEPSPCTSLPQTNTHSLTHSLPHTRLFLPIALIHTFTAWSSYCTAVWKTRCLLTVEQTCSLQRKILDTHSDTLPCTCNKKQQKVILLIFASDNRGSQSRECSKRLRTPVVKLTCNHNATPCVFWRSNMIGSVARGRSSVLIWILIYLNQSYRWMFSLDLFRSNTLVPLNIPIRCKIHFAGNKQSR